MRPGIFAPPLLLIFSCLGLAAPEGAPRPNFVLMMADDLGWGDLGCYNSNSPIKTPHLDAMAANGVRFERFYSASAVCSPTRASFLTGRHPDRMGVTNANAGHLPVEEFTIQRALQGQGYRTGHFGKWHLGTLTKTVKDSNRGGPRGVAHFAPPWERDFDTCFSTEAKTPTWDPMVRPADAETKGTWWTPAGPGDETVAYNTRYWNERGEIVTDNLKGDDSRVIMDRAIPFIEESVKSKKPFLAVVWFHSPHLPVVAGGGLAELYREHEEYEQAYYGCVTGIDKEVGRLRAKLRELGVADNTVVFFCSDNGPEGNSTAPGQANGLKGRKRDLYEGGIRVPGILEWPAQVNPTVVKETPAFTSDLLPSVLEIIGQDHPDNRPIDGTSLLPILADPKTPRGKPLGFKYTRRAAWMEGQWKIVRPKDNSPWELYNLSQNIGEKTDLAKNHPDRVTQMAAAWETWRTSVKASAAGADY